VCCCASTVHVVLCVALPRLSHLFSWPEQGEPCRLFYLLFPLYFNVLCSVEFCTFSMFLCHNDFHFSEECVLRLSYSEKASWHVCFLSEIWGSRNGHYEGYCPPDCGSCIWISTVHIKAACAVLLMYRKSRARKNNLHGGRCFVVNVYSFTPVDCTASIFHLHQIQLFTFSFSYVVWHNFLG